MPEHTKGKGVNDVPTSKERFCAERATGSGRRWGST